MQLEEVLEHVNVPSYVSGRSTRQIAEELHLSIETVHNHIRHLLRAIGAHSRLEAVAIANQAN